MVYLYLLSEREYWRCFNLILFKLNTNFNFLTNVIGNIMILIRHANRIIIYYISVYHANIIRLMAIIVLYLVDTYFIFITISV